MGEIMITSEEHESIINDTVERVFKMLPEVVGNLMAANAIYAAVGKKFYGDNPELAKHKEIVKEVVGKIEGRDPTKSYEDILKEALPEIRKQVGMKSSISMGVADESKLNLSINSNGAL